MSASITDTHDLAGAAVPKAGVSRWFSPNPDKAWAEKFFLTFVPVFFIYNAVLIHLGFLDVGNLWNVVLNLAMWIPYCVLLPLWLRRNSGVAWHRSYWFKFNIYQAVFIFFATYFHTEYFFEILGIRYNFPKVTLLFDSYLLGPNEATALAEHKKIPIGMYFNSVAFFIVYHTLAVIAMRRVRNTLVGSPQFVQSIGWVVIVAATAWFFGWAEPYFYNTQPGAQSFSYYVDIEAMLTYGAIFYSMYFLVSFPNVFRLDETAAGERWTIGQTIIEASFVSMLTLFLLDAWSWFFGPLA